MYTNRSFNCTWLGNTKTYVVNRYLEVNHFFHLLMPKLHLLNKNQKLEKLNKTESYINNAQYFMQSILNMTGYSYAQAAKLLSVSPSTVKNIIKGTTKQPRHKVFKKILIFYCKIKFNNNQNK